MYSTSFCASMEKHSLNDGKKRKYHHESTLPDAEVMLLVLPFHNSGNRNLKHFHLELAVGAFGFKLHLTCNERGGLLYFMTTPVNADARKAFEDKGRLLNLSDLYRAHVNIIIWHPFAM